MTPYLRLDSVLRGIPCLLTIAITTIILILAGTCLQLGLRGRPGIVIADVPHQVQ